MLESTWAGYNCCLFAYGQTGSGKSYSIVGYEANKGIIPIACKEVFERKAEVGELFINLGELSSPSRRFLVLISADCFGHADRWTARLAGRPRCTSRCACSRPASRDHPQKNSPRFMKEFAEIHKKFAEIHKEFAEGALSRRCACSRYTTSASAISSSR